MSQQITAVEPPFGVLWKVARVDVNAWPFTPDRTELFAWLAKLGIDHTNCYPTLVISQRPDRTLLLHVSQFARDVDGGKYVDFAADRVHTEPLVVEITDYPAWLVQASHQQDQNQKGEQPCLSSRS